MPRDGSGVYTRPPGTDAVADTTIESAKYNTNVADVEADLNAPRPIVAGGTAATSADNALTSLSAEKAKQVVSNWDTAPWRAGSFYAATSAAGVAPVAGHAFAGIAYYANSSDLVLQATDLTNPGSPTQYVRTQTAGVWNAWIAAGGSSVAPGLALVGDYTFDTTVTFPPGSGQVRFNNATQNSTTELFFSHLTATGIDVTTALPLTILNGSEITIRDKATPTKYKIFTATAATVLSSGDFRVTATFKSGGTDLTASPVQASTTGQAVRYDIAQTLTSAQKALARANIDALKKNYILNGAMQISQENGVTAGTANGYYAADQWSLSNGSSGTLSVAQVASPTPAGSPNRLRGTVTVADAAVAATDFVVLRQAIEGLRVADLRSGSAAAKTITIQFGVKAPAGTYSVILQNSTPRAYVAEYVIAAGEANTDVVKSVTIQLDTTGTWATDNTIGLLLYWGLMCGTTYQTPAGTWVAGNFLGSSNQFNFMGTINNVFELFDVGLYEGAVAPSFQVPDYASELALCRRYYSLPEFGVQNGSVAASANYGGSAPYPVPMRATPTVAFKVAITAPANATGTYIFASITANSTFIYLAALGAGSFQYYIQFSANARM